MSKLVILLCALVAIGCLFAIYATTPSSKKQCISDHFDNPTDPLSPSSPSGASGAAGGPGVSTAAMNAMNGATGQMDTSGIQGVTATSGLGLAGSPSGPGLSGSPINAPPSSVVPYSGWTPASGTTPSAAQSSAISNTLPNSTVSDPSQSIAQQQDIQSTLDAIKTFQTFAANTTPSMYPDPVRQQVAETMNAINDITLPLNTAQLNPSSSALTVAQLSAIRDRIGATTKALSQLSAAQGGGAAATSVPAGSAGSAASVGSVGSVASVGSVGSASADVITLDQMKTLVMRVKATLLALTNLSSTDATITQRIGVLSQLKANLEDLVTKVSSNAMDIKDVPIKPAEAQAFLKVLDDKTIPLPPLIGVAGGNNGTPLNYDPKASAAALQGFTQAFQTVMSHVKFQMTYDPSSSQNAAVMARLQAVEDKLFAHAASSTPVTPAILELLKQELTVLGAIVKADPTNHADYSPANSLPSMSTRLEGDTGSAPSNPTMEQLMLASGGPLGPSGSLSAPGSLSPPGPFLNPVVNPGLTDAQRAARGSAAAFDESTVGGYNYRDRAIEVCRQVKAEYGDNSTFGCIADPNSVSSDYSWKGNYLSVCNRLGDAWGSQAGDKYGCPPFDPSRKFRQS